MIEGMLTQEELENDCPEYMDDLELFLEQHPQMKDSPEATVYVLAQALHERIINLDCDLEQKGGIISTVLNGFIEFNGAALAAYHELKKTILEQKSSTVH